MTQKCIQCKDFSHTSTCHGCEETFCDEHMTKHRESLSHRMNHIDQEYQHFEENLNENNPIQSYLSRIDQWEHQSITQIQKTAETARHDLFKLSDRMKNEIKSSFDQIHHDLQTNRKLNNYTETHLNQWMEQLKQLRRIYQTSFTEDIIDETQSIIPSIKIIDRNQSFAIEDFDFPSQEKFAKPIDPIDPACHLPDDIHKAKESERKKYVKVKKMTLSKDRLTATCVKPDWNGSNVNGTRLYSSGVHSIRFRITKKGQNDLFFGITSSVEETNPWNRKTPFAYGWWDLPSNQMEEEEEKKKIKQVPTIQTNDEVTLTLDCLNNQIQFEHHRTNRYDEKTIPNEQCPLPWKLAIVLYSPGDSVQILS